MAKEPSEPSADKAGTEPAGADPKLDSLEQRLAHTRKVEEKRLAREHVPMADPARSIGMQVASTLVGYPLGGIVIGWGLDGVFHTRPWIMIVLMFMAFAAACLQVVRVNNARQDRGGE